MKKTSSESSRVELTCSLMRVWPLAAMQINDFVGIGVHIEQVNEATIT